MQTSKLDKYQLDSENWGSSRNGNYTNMIIHPCLFILLKEFRHTVLYGDTCTIFHCRHISSVISSAGQENSCGTGKILRLHSWMTSTTEWKHWHSLKTPWKKNELASQPTVMNQCIWSHKKCNQIKFQKTSTLLSAIIWKSEQRPNKETVVCFGKAPQAPFI